MDAEALWAPPSRSVAEGSLNSAQVCWMPASSFLNVTEKSFPAGTARQAWAKPFTLAPTRAVTVTLVLPEGRQVRPVGDPEGLGAREGAGCPEGFGPEGPTGGNCTPFAGTDVVVVAAGGLAEKAAHNPSPSNPTTTTEPSKWSGPIRFGTVSSTNTAATDASTPKMTAAMIGLDPISPRGAAPGDMSRKDTRPGSFRSVAAGSRWTFAPP